MGACHACCDHSSGHRLPPTPTHEIDKHTEEDDSDEEPPFTFFADKEEQEKRLAEAKKKLAKTREKFMEMAE